MLNFLKNLSLTPQGMRHKLSIAFFLMSLIPILVCLFFVLAYINPATSYGFVIGTGHIFVIVSITFFITVLGFLLVRQMVDPVVTIAKQAKQAAEGKVDTTFDVKSEDEIGELSEALNRMTARIKETISELRTYGEKTKEINIDIHNKVLTLSNLLEIGNLISSGAPLEELVKVLLEKMGQLEMTSASFVYLLEAPGVMIRYYTHEIDAQKLTPTISFGSGLLGEVASQGEPLITDSYSGGGAQPKAFKEALNLRNIAVFPISSHGTVTGLLGTGNVLAPFKYKPEDLETIKVFVKQLSLAVENDQLKRKAKELEMRDELTQLYNEKFTRQRLDEEIKRAIHYQRPCSFILVDIDDFDEIKEQHQVDLLKKLAKELEGLLTDADRAARVDRDIFALIVPERNKREATQLAETFRRRVEELYGGNKSFHGREITVSAGVSENPIDGSTAEALIQKAKDALATAKSLGKNRVGA